MEFNNATVESVILQYLSNFSMMSGMFPAPDDVHACIMHTHVGKGFASLIRALLRILHPDVIVPRYEVRHAYQASEVGFCDGNFGVTSLDRRGGGG